MNMNKVSTNVFQPIFQCGKVIQFKNDKPAKRFINEMQMITGLGMGQLRTAQEIKNLESAASTGGSTGTLDGDAAAEKAGKVTRSFVQTYSPEVKEEKPKKENSEKMKKWISTDVLNKKYYVL